MDALDKIKGLPDYKKDAENRRYISELEEKINLLSTQKEYAALDSSRRVADTLQKLVHDDTILLITEDEPLKRANIKGRRQAIIMLLKIYTRDYGKEIESIVSEIERIANTFL